METEPLPTDPVPQDESPATPAAAAWTPEAAEAALNAAVDAERVVTSGKMDDDTLIIADPDRAASPSAVPEVHAPGADDDAEEDLRCRRYDDDDEEEDLARSTHRNGVVGGDGDSERKGPADEHAPAAPQDVGDSSAEGDSDGGEDTPAAAPAPASGLAQWVGRAVGFLEGSPVVRGVLRAAWVPLVIGLGVATVRPGITLLDALAPINFRDRTAV